MNQEISNTLGVARAHGSIGAFVSQLTVNKTTLEITAATDLGKTMFLWDATANGGTGGYVRETSALSRLCSADLPAINAVFDPTTGLGTTDRIFMNGEETGTEGRPLTWVVTGADAGKAYELPRFGDVSIENLVASPNTGSRTVVIGQDDSTPGQVYVYIGDRQATGSAIEKAGLTNGSLYGIAAATNRCPGLITESGAGRPPFHRK